MKIIDAFIFNDELDMLDFRLNYLSPYVDHFLLIESPVNFAGKEKPLYYELNKHRYRQFQDQLTSYQVTGLEDLSGSWEREHSTRNALAHARHFTNADDDIILMSDIDEIPDVRRLHVEMRDFLPCVLRQYFFYYSVNWIKPMTCDCTIIVTAGQLKEVTPQQLRDTRYNLTLTPIMGGWHFSYFGGVAMIQNKVKAFAHQEYNKEPYITTEHIESCLKTGKDLFFREHEDCMPFKNPKILPSYLLDNRETYAFFWGEE